MFFIQFYEKLKLYYIKILYFQYKVMAYYSLKSTFNVL